MQIHNNTLIAECSAYDFKEMLERKKVKSWLKSVSAFANTDGGSLFYGVNDDGVIVGLENLQTDADFISEMIKARLDPVPEIHLIPIEHEGHSLLEVKIKAGMLTPYYYYQDGTRTAYTRVGNESVECNSQQLLSLVLKGTHMTWDSLPTPVDAGKHSFVILANTFREQTRQEWNDKYLESFGLVTSDGKLTNAGLLFVDNCTVFQSRIFCTRWTGLYKDDAISSVEHRANLVLLLKYGMDFIKNYTMSGWVKKPNYRLNLPDYSDRARTEASSFFTTFYNLNWNESGRIPVEEVANRVNSAHEKNPASGEKFGVNDDDSEKRFGVNAEKFGVNDKSSEKKFGVSKELQKSVNRTGQKIIDLVISDPSLTAEAMSAKIGVSKRAIEKNIKVLREYGILIHEGSDKAGYWRIIVNPQTE